MNPSHSYDSQGLYTVELTVTDNQGAFDTQSSTVSITLPPPPPSEPIEVFADSFEVKEWNGLWNEDSQRDWMRWVQRAVDGRYSAEVDGPANNSLLTSVPINLQGRRNARVAFSWYIEGRFAAGAYLAFDVSTDGGTSWSEVKRLRGNVDPEEVWHHESFEFKNISRLQIRFRAKISTILEDANVDRVKVSGF
jgi:PKD repeat protein